MSRIFRSAPGDGNEQSVQVRYDEGVANHIGPEPCAVAREGASPSRTVSCDCDEYVCFTVAVNKGERILEVGSFVKTQSVVTNIRREALARGPDRHQHEPR